MMRVTDRDGEGVGGVGGGQGHTGKLHADHMVHLLLGGMANPEKVLGFLDIAGLWDPSLALVMAGALAIGAPAYALASFRGRSFLELPIDKPTKQTLDKRLVLGSASFGIGWGLAGICPGPAFVLLGSGSFKGMVFFAFMLLGFVLFD